MLASDISNGPAPQTLFYAGLSLRGSHPPTRAITTLVRRAAVDTGYHKKDKQGLSDNHQRYRGVSYVKPITAAKENVPIIELAGRLTSPSNLRKIGDTWSANCPLPDHEDKTPSFVIYPESESWYCYGCLRGGDVVELYRLAKGYDQRDAHTAAAMLLLEFGHEVPKRSPAWFRKQER